MRNAQVLIRTHSKCFHLPYIKKGKLMGAPDRSSVGDICAHELQLRGMIPVIKF